MSKVISKEEFIARLKEKYSNNEYVIVGEFVNMTTKIKVRHNCEYCGNYEWDVNPSSLLKGHGCPKCAGCLKKTHEEFEGQLKKMYGDEYDVLEKYINSNTKILFRHNKCGHEWKTYPSSILKSHGCPKCNGGLKDKTTSIFKEEVRALFGDEYEILGEYIKAKEKIRIRHNKCGYEWDAYSHRFMKSKGCPKCNKAIKNKTTNYFKNEIVEKFGEGYEVLGEYKNCSTPIKMKHLECGHEWEAPPHLILISRGCPKCSLKQKILAQRKSHETFENEIKELYEGKITLLERYINNRTKIRVRNNECGHEWDITPSNLLRKRNCPFCKNKKTRLKCTKTQEKFESEVKELFNDELIVLGKYINRNTPILIKHKVCDYEWNIYPYNLLKSKGCPKCKKTKKDKTTTLYKEEVRNKFGEDYEVLSEYKGAKELITIKHKKCGQIWNIYPNNFLKSCGCRFCNNPRRKSQEKIEKEIYDLVKDEYSVLGKYISQNEKLRLRHNKCGYEWDANIKCFLNGTRCPSCFGTPKKNTKLFKNEVLEKYGKDFKVLSEYKSAKESITLKHKCGYEWKTTPNSFLRSGICPNCDVSSGEEKISRVLNKLGICFIKQYKLKECMYKRSLSFDFAIIKDGQVLGLIEYDGEQHFSIKHFFGCKNEERTKKEYAQIKIRDEIKNKYCKDNKIPLLRIKYTQFKEIDTIIEHFLNNLDNYIDNHSFGMSDEEYYKDRK